MRKWLILALVSLVVLSGGINIAENEPVSQPKVSAEWLVQNNPDIIIKYAPEKTTGIAVTNADAAKALRKEILSRPGLGTTTAVKKGQVFVINCGLIWGTRSAAGLYYLAKIFHPDLFQDIEPEAIYREMLRKFHHEELRGIWVYPAI